MLATRQTAPRGALASSAERHGGLSDQWCHRASPASDSDAAESSVPPCALGSGTVRGFTSTRLGRPATFNENDRQRAIAATSKAALEKSGRFTHAHIEVVPAGTFHPAEECRQYQ